MNNQLKEFRKRGAIALATSFVCGLTASFVPVMDIWLSFVSVGTGLVGGVLLAYGLLGDLE